MTELAVADFAAAVGWYRDVIGLTLDFRDDATAFALFSGGIALKRGVPVPGGVKLHFRVPDLDAELARLAAAGVEPESPAKASPEGYRRAIFRDPDGYAVVLFEWLTRKVNPSHRCSASGTDTDTDTFTAFPEAQQ